MRIFFSPDCPTTQDYSIVAMIHYLGFSVARTIEQSFDIAYLWQDATFLEPSLEILKLAQIRPVLNINCTDISKVKVDEVWANVSGNTSLVDPRRHIGPVIKKFNANGQGGGEIIHCPVDQSVLSPNLVYQRYLKTRERGAQLEYRVPFVMGEIPIIFEVLKDDPEEVAEKKIKNQFKRSITPKATTEIFSQSEISMIVEFCRQIGFEIGELDVLRCRQTSSIYVIDVNTTPTYFNMFNQYWKPRNKRKAIAAVAECWENQLRTRLATG